MYNFKGQPNINSLLKQHSLMVKRIAHHMYAKLPASVEVDDLIQVGMMGLADAISKYDSQHGAQFETYANQRIRGAILDELRSTDWMSRTSRKEQKIIENYNWAKEHSWKNQAHCLINEITKLH
jgi:RNA polymerase sigma factor for flagellar operon FliA